MILFVSSYCRILIDILFLFLFPCSNPTTDRPRKQRVTSDGMVQYHPRHNTGEGVVRSRAHTDPRVSGYTFVGGVSPRASADDKNRSPQELRLEGMSLYEPPPGYGWSSYDKRSAGDSGNRSRSRSSCIVFSGLTETLNDPSKTNSNYRRSSYDEKRGSGIPPLSSTSPRDTSQTSFSWRVSRHSNSSGSGDGVSPEGEKGSWEDSQFATRASQR